jgi:hypothetical protein
MKEGGTGARVRVDASRLRAAARIQLEAGSTTACHLQPSALSASLKRGLTGPSPSIQTFPLPSFLDATA